MKEISAVIVKYRAVDETIPFYKHDSGDAGYDMYVTEDTWIFPLAIRKVPVNLRCEIPKGYYGYVTSRSGETLKGNVVVPGIIDSTYRGIINALVTRIGFLPRKIKKGTRIAQLIIQPYKDIVWEKANDLSETSRGNNGFGSTGVR